VFIGSVDWMPRNFFRRIETVVPIEDPALRVRITDQILGSQLADNTKASVLNAEGVYLRPEVKKPSEQRNSQAEFMALSLGEAKVRKKRRTASGPYLNVEPAPKLRPS
jgi:polyphosphate kinase